MCYPLFHLCLVCRKPTREDYVCRGLCFEQQVQQPEIVDEYCNEHAMHAGMHDQNPMRALPPIPGRMNGGYANDNNQLCVRPGGQVIPAGQNTGGYDQGVAIYNAPPGGIVEDRDGDVMMSDMEMDDPPPPYEEPRSDDRTRHGRFGTGFAETGPGWSRPGFGGNEHGSQNRFPEPEYGCERTNHPGNQRIRSGRNNSRAEHFYARISYSRNEHSRSGATRSRAEQLYWEASYSSTGHSPSSVRLRMEDRLAEFGRGAVGPGLALPFQRRR